MTENVEKDWFVQENMSIKKLDFYWTIANTSRCLNSYS